MLFNPFLLRDFEQGGEGEQTTQTKDAATSNLILIHKREQQVGASGQMEVKSPSILGLG
jgi:hypothetical protein